MNYKASHKLFTAKDIEAYLGIDANTLYHWVQTKKLIRPKKIGVGRGSKHQFSLRNLASISLAKTLYSYRIELSTIKYIFKKIFHSRPELPANFKQRPPLLYLSKLDIWMYYEYHYRKHKEEGYYLMLSMPRNGQVDRMNFAIAKSAGVQQVFDTTVANQRGSREFTCHLVVDLFAIIDEIEKKTGEEF